MNIKLLSADVFPLSNCHLLPELGKKTKLHLIKYMSYFFLCAKFEVSALLAVLGLEYFLILKKLMPATERYLTVCLNVICQ